MWILELERVMGQAQEMVMGLLPVSVVKRVPVKMAQVYSRRQGLPVTPIE